MLCHRKTSAKPTSQSATRHALYGAGAQRRWWCAAPPPPRRGEETAVDAAAAAAAAAERADVADEVIGLPLPHGAEAVLGARGEHLGGEHAAHLPPLVPERRDAGAAVADAKGLGGERGGAVGEDGVVPAAEHLAGHLGARDGDHVDGAEAHAHDASPRVGQQAVQPPVDRLVGQHLVHVAQHRQPPRPRRQPFAAAGAFC